MTPTDAQGLLEYGPMGLIVIVIVVLLVPLIGAFFWYVKKIATAFTDEIKAGREERSDIGTASRQERTETADRYERLVNQQSAAMADNSRSLRQLCRALEQRPCILHTGGLLNGEGEEHGG